MRDLKFRGQMDGNKKWVYGSLVNNLWSYSELTDRKGQSVFEIITPDYTGDCWEDIAQDDENSIVRVIPETVGQYTGLKDKNGKEIYEGDIIRRDGIKTFEIRWTDCMFFCVGSDYHLGTTWFQASEIEVIGNIYETPELSTPLTSI